MSTQDERIDLLTDALQEIIRREDKAWKPFQVFRSERDVELDDARHEAWTEAADIARKALGALSLSQQSTE